MKKLFLLLVTVLSITLCASAQTRTVTGVVLEEGTEDPIIGASVTAGSSKTGVATDMDGMFSIQVPAGVKTLTISHVGFAAQKVEITGKPLVVVLRNSAERLNEVMVVAYGTTTKAAYTGSAGVVKADQLEDALVSNVTNALSGRVAGVQTLNSNGQPGTGSTVLIRGVGSINGSTTPLYVVDGMPFDGGISQIAPSDIESMTVLKDAASTALYGARGANGVILITTKKGQEGAAKVTLDARWGSNSRALGNYDVITNPKRYMEMLYQNLYTTSLMDNYVAGGDNTAAMDQAHRYANSQLFGALGQQMFTVPSGQYLIGADGKFNPNATYGYSDGHYYYTPDNWTDETLIHGLRQEYNLSIQGGSRNFTYYVGGGYLGDEGIIDGSHYNRFSTRTNVDYQAKPWLKVGTNMSYVYANSGYPASQTNNSYNSSANAFSVINQIAPVYPMYVRDAQGNVMWNDKYNRPLYDYGLTYDYGYGIIAQRASGGWATANPKGTLIYDTSDYLMDVFDAKWYAILTPLKGLTISATAGYMTDNTRYHSVDNSLYGQSASTGGKAEQEASRERTINLQGLATYQRTFADVHDAEIMLGVESQDYNYEYTKATGKNLYNPDNWTVDNTIDQRYGEGLSRSLAHRSGFGRVKYTYDNKYFFMGSYRRDGSSAFHPDHRWGSFWSLSAAWDMKKESFLRDVTAVDLLKFKVSFGQNGNDRIYPSALLMAYTDFYTVTGSNGVFADSDLAYKGNPDITWEKSNNFNVGFDFSFFNGALDGTIEYYSRQTSDMLMNLPVPASLGYSSIPSNVGSMRNYGFEVDLNWRAINTKDVTLDLFANATLSRNKVISLPEQLLNSDGDWEYSAERLITEGKPLYNMYLVHYAGVDPETGIALYTAKRDRRYESIPSGADESMFQAVKDAGGNVSYYTRWTGAYKQNYKGEYLNAAGEPIDFSKQEGTQAEILAKQGVKIYEQEEYDTTNWTEARTTNCKRFDNVYPKVYGGFGFNFTAYGFDLGMQFAYQAGGQIFDTGYQYLMNSGDNQYIGKTWHKDMQNAWTPTNTNTNVPRMANSGLAADYDNALSDRFLISSNYVSLNNITFGYTFPTKWVKTLGLSELRVYGSAENVALWSKRKGLDPRQGYISSNNATYSPIRCISGGVKLSF